MSSIQPASVLDPKTDAGVVPANHHEDNGHGHGDGHGHGHGHDAGQAALYISDD